MIYKFKMIKDFSNSKSVSGKHRMHHTLIKYYFMKFMKFMKLILFSVDQCMTYNASGLITERCPKSVAAALPASLAQIPNLSSRRAAFPRVTCSKLRALHWKRRGSHICI